MRGLGQVQNLAIAKSKDKVFSFIERNQPVNYKDIQNHSHVRRNKIRNYVDGLVKDQKITRINSVYFTHPPSSNIIKKIQKQDQFFELLKLVESSNNELQYIIKKIESLKKEQPLRFKIIEKRLCFNFNDHINFLKNIKKIDVENLTPEMIGSFFDSHFDSIKNFLEFIDEWTLRQNLVPRFEYTHFKNVYDNKCGIHPKFRNKDGSLNETKIEGIYRYKIFLGCCLCCGEYVADYFNQYLKAHSKLTKGKITQEEYNNIVELCEKRGVRYKIIKDTEYCPHEFMVKGKPLPKDLIRIKN